jgi:hypothetical protein
MFTYLLAIRNTTSHSVRVGNHLVITIFCVTAYYVQFHFMYYLYVTSYCELQGSVKHNGKFMVLT